MSREILGHPKGLFVLFFTEMWERFSYYGMRALLVLYMTRHLLEQLESGQSAWGLQTLKLNLEALYGPLGNQALASQIYGLYTGFVYLTPFFGGLLADQFLGRRRSVYWGGFLMAIGHLLMAVESMFLPALFFLIIGNGFFKPNISTQVGELYALDDKRRDRAYTIFYMGVNLGALLAPFVCGTLGQKVGWHYGFGAAGIGMLIGLLVYHLGRKHLPPDTFLLNKEAIHDNPTLLKDEINQKLTTDDYKRVFALIFMCAVTVMFWGVYEQQGNTLQLWADENTNWSLFGWQMPSTWFQAFNPLLIIALAPLLDRYWGWQEKSNREAGSVAKMGIGCLWAALAYIFMVGVLHVMGDGKAHWLLLFTCILFFTIGELYLSPIGLSLVTKISPPQIVSMMMGVWLMSSFFGNYMAGLIGMYYERLGDENFFWLLSAMSGGAGLIFLMAVRPLRKVLQGH